jgi:hypothetical protein
MNLAAFLGEREQPNHNQEALKSVLDIGERPTLTPQEVAEAKRRAIKEAMIRQKQASEALQAQVVEQNNAQTK